jgi:hypothetical protein
MYQLQLRPHCGLFVHTARHEIATWPQTQYTPLLLLLPPLLLIAQPPPPLLLLLLLLLLLAPPLPFPAHSTHQQVEQAGV